jgi:hypothetical protein
MSLTLSPTGEWYMDTGADIHMMSDLGNLSTPPLLLIPPL